MLGQQQILIIDDSEAILMVVKTMLARMGFEKITTMTSATKALAVVGLEPARFQIILTDLRMPDTDGLDVLRKLGEMGFKGAVAIISEMDRRIINLAADIARRHRLHMIGCICKPVQLDDLSALVEKASELRVTLEPPAALLTREQVQTAFNQIQVIPYYQPKVDLNKCQVVGVEALARIRFPGEINALRPCRFMPVIQEYGMLPQLSQRMLQQACKDLPTIRSILGNDIKISLNISPEELENTYLADSLEHIWRKSGTGNDSLVLEITEEHYIHNSAQLESLNRLRLRGFGLSLDDFGTGFTNINQLRDLPYTEVKIDRSLIINIHRDSFCQAILNGLVEIARQLGITLVAEGIEHMDELKYLMQTHPELVLQGYLISLPRSLDTLNTWHKGWQHQFGNRANIHRHQPPANED